ncbi:putative gpi anchored serine-threonine rich protein [Diaporthe ampelina]|uniref:Putative gpi anchored serine-threonine rich protein n=1 Tax=Diaporthe ampelina TaxID=1214573 RepID=A0A0G2HU64_9PEZI|nr:putative gpi anchored serine-threonine rich protein [Diaporthe ampelina]
MQFSFYAATCLALVSRVFAQTEGFDAITAPTKDQTLAAGTTSTVTWDYNPQYAGTVTITLLQGATPETLQLGSAIATGIDNSAGSYTWNIDSSLGADATYGLRISLDSDPATFQYSFPFHIAASSGTSSGSSSGSSDVSDPVTPTGTGTPSSSSSAIATAGAAKVVAGSFAAMGGLAAALFAL